MTEVTKGSVFYALETPERAAALTVRSNLMIALCKWIDKNELSNAAAARQLGVTRPRISNLRNGHISKFTIDALVELCETAGIKVTCEAKVPRKKAA